MPTSESPPHGLSQTLYTVPEAAEVLHLNPATIWKLARQGRLRLVKIGKRTTIRRDDLAALIDAASNR